MPEVIPNGSQKILDAQAMERVTGKLQESSDELVSECNRLDDICNNLQTIFQGNCAKAYIEAIENIRDNVLTPMQKLLASYPATIEEAKKNAFAKDQQLADGIRGTYSSLY
jgi:uncharacterized protein YukE